MRQFIGPVCINGTNLNIGDVIKFTLAKTGDVVHEALLAAKIDDEFWLPSASIEPGDKGCYVTEDEVTSLEVSLGVEDAFLFHSTGRFKPGQEVKIFSIECQGLRPKLATCYAGMVTAFNDDSIIIADLRYVFPADQEVCASMIPIAELCH